MLIVDSQIHLWEADRPDRPWPKDRPTHAHRPNPLEADEMIAAMNQAGVDRAVIVPPSWTGEQNDTALEGAQKYPGRFAIMGRFDPQAPGARKRIETWRQQPYMLGMRFTFHVPEWAAWLEDESWKWVWAAAERLGIPLMIHVPGVAPRVGPIAERHPGLTLVIDHLARFNTQYDAAGFADLDDVLALARFPNVAVKVSALPCHSSESYPFPTLHPIIRRVYDTFGPRRMLWGSDYSRLPCSYRECVNLFREALDFLSDEDKEWILGRATLTTLGWKD